MVSAYPADRGRLHAGSHGEREKLRRIQLPEDLRGKSVLDIGCNEGFFAFEAERRGAAYVLAIDSDAMARKKFHVVKHLLKSNVEFLLLSVSDSTSGRSAGST